MFIAHVAEERSLSEPPAVAGGFYADAESSHTNELAHRAPAGGSDKTHSLDIGGRVLAHEVLKGLFVVSGDLPGVSTWVSDHATAIAIGHVLWFFERFATGIQRPLVGRVNIIYIEVEERRHRVADANFAHHHERVAHS